MTEPIFQGPDAPTDDDLASCVHCGLCLDQCPTYRVTGLETESPRGRLFLMQQWKRGGLPFTEDLARHIDLCLGCRTCEAVCPSGVPYGRIIEGARAEVERVRRPSVKRGLVNLGLGEVLAHPRRLDAVGALTRGAQAMGLTAISRMGRSLPPLTSPFRPPDDGVAPAVAPRRFSVAFLVGCVMPIMFPDAHAAAVRLLQVAGCDVRFPPAQACCGALHAHNGDLEGSRSLRAHNLKAFDPGEFDALVIDSAGCSAHMREFYPSVDPAWDGKVRDLFEFLAEVGLPSPRPIDPVRVTYQDPCHLAHAQRIVRQPRDLLASIPGVEFVEMPHADLCCGAAGLYNVLEPDMSSAVLEAKTDDLAAVAPELVVTANPGCQMQLAAGLKRRGLDIPVQHLAELLVRAY